MIAQDQIRNLVGATVFGRDEEKVGKAGQVFLDDETGHPEWVTVNTGLFGTKESFVPLAGASAQVDRITVNFTKGEIKDAPSIDADQHLAPEEEERLYAHYGLKYSRERSNSGLPEGGVSGGNVDRRDYDAKDYDTKDYDTKDYDRASADRGRDDAMTRSEERLNVGTRREEVGRARLRKYVVTENVQQTVPVTREEVRIEREPITEANAGKAMSGSDISEDEHEVTLHAERPVVEKETVPVERVRLSKETVTDDETVSEEVRKERIETEGAEDADLKSSKRR